MDAQCSAQLCPQRCVVLATLNQQTDDERGQRRSQRVLNAVRRLRSHAVALKCEAYALYLAAAIRALRGTPERWLPQSLLTPSARWI